MNSSGAFALATAGVFGIYLECIRPGRVLPGALGLVSFVVGAKSIAANHPTGKGLSLLTAAALLFSLDAIIETRSFLGLSGGICLFLGASVLFREPTPTLSVVSAFATSIAFTIVTVWIASIARRARRNKRMDL